jgi:hypothetical protein
VPQAAEQLLPLAEADVMKVVNALDELVHGNALIGNGLSVAEAGESFIDTEYPRRKSTNW